MNHRTTLIGAIVVLSLVGVVSVVYIGVRLASNPDKAFLVGVVIAFLVPTVTALLAALRGEAVVKAVNGVAQQVADHLSNAPPGA